MVTGSPRRSRGSLDDLVLKTVRELQPGAKKYAYASERGIREEIERRTGRRVGARSIGRSLGRLAAKGLVLHRRVLPGRRMANGKITSHGTQHNRVIPRWEKRRRDREAASRERMRQANARRHGDKTPSVRPSSTPLDPQQLQALRAELQAILGPFDAPTAEAHRRLQTASARQEAARSSAVLGEPQSRPGRFSSANAPAPVARVLEELQLPLCTPPLRPPKPPGD